MYYNSTSKEINTNNLKVIGKVRLLVEKCIAKEIVKISYINGNENEF